MYKEKVCSMGMTLRLFWMAQLNYPFYNDLKTTDLNGLEGLTFLKGLDYILIDFMGIDYLMASEAGHVPREGLLCGYDSETFLDGTIKLPFL